MPFPTAPNLTFALEGTPLFLDNTLVGSASPDYAYPGCTYSKNANVQTTHSPSQSERYTYQFDGDPITPISASARVVARAGVLLPAALPDTASGNLVRVEAYFQMWNSSHTLSTAIIARTIFQYTSGVLDATVFGVSNGMTNDYTTLGDLPTLGANYIISAAYNGGDNTFDFYIGDQLLGSKPNYPGYTYGLARVGLMIEDRRATPIQAVASTDVGYMKSASIFVSGPAAPRWQNYLNTFERET